MHVLVKFSFVFLSVFLIGLIPSVFASQAVSMAPLDVASTHGQPAQFTIIVYEPAEGGSVDILISFPANSPYGEEDVNRVSVQSPKGNVALNYGTFELIGKVDTFSGSEGHLEIPVSITIDAGTPAGEYGVSIHSVLPNGNTNGFANGVLRITGTTTQPENPPENPPPEFIMPSTGNPQIVGIQMATDYDKAKKYKIGDSLDISWVTAKNFGDGIGTKNIKLIVSRYDLGKSQTDILQSHDVSLNPGETKSYPGKKYVFEKTGSYEFRWDDQIQIVTVTAESGDPRDQPVTSVGKPNIYGKSMALDDLSTKFEVGQKITITSVSAQNAGDVTGTKTIPFKMTVSHQGNTKKQTLFSEKFTLGAGKSELRTVNYELELKEPGSYVLEWGSQSHMFQVVIANDPRDKGSASGGPMIKGRGLILWPLDDVDYFAGTKINIWVLCAKNYGDEKGTREIDLKATHFRDGKSSSDVIYSHTFTLEPGQFMCAPDVEPLQSTTYVPKEAGFYTFEWDTKQTTILVKPSGQDPRDEPIVSIGGPNIIGLPFEARPTKSEKYEHDDLVIGNGIPQYFVGREISFGLLEAQNRGDTKGTREIPFTVTYYPDKGKSATETIFAETFTLEPNDIEVSSKGLDAAYIPKKHGTYVFEWDGHTQIAKTVQREFEPNNDPRDEPIASVGGPNIIGLSFFQYENPKDKSIKITEIVAKNFGDELGTRTIPFNVIHYSDGKTSVETLSSQTFALNPGESENVMDITYYPKKTGAYLFEWDQMTQIVHVSEVAESETIAEPVPEIKNGCLIATAAFGTELAPQVQLLREVRDNALLGTSSGTSFMAGFNDFYYSFSPGVADLERQSPIFREMIKITITPMLLTLSILQFVDIDSEQEMLGYGIGIILLNIGMYFVAPAAIIIKIHSRIQNHRK